jgi:DNA-binding NarL/FixJ family response regulator
MSMSDRLGHVGPFFEPQKWGDVFEELSAARREGRLGVEDLERLAVAAYMIGKDIESADAWMGAHQEWLRRDQPERAASCAFWQALLLFFRGDLAPGMGWVARGRRILESGRYDCVEQAWLHMLTALPLLFQGEVESADRDFVAGGEIAERFGDPDATTFARLGRGMSLFMQEDLAEGISLLDEVMATVTAGEVSPIIAGIAYCQVIDLCMGIFDLRRAKEWTQALSAWCDLQPGLVPFRGHCLVHRCQIFQLQGAWRDALNEAQRACELLSGPPPWDALGSAFYQLAEIQRLRGEFDQAEASFRKAAEAGRDPEPGMSLLRLAQGRVDVAAAAIRRALEEAQDPIARAKLLPAYVEIMLESKDVTGAREAAVELSEIAAELDRPYVDALAAHALGAVFLAEGDAKSALVELRKAQASWRNLDAPHQVARVRVSIGLACRLLADDASAELEFETARAVFEELDAAIDLENLALLSGTQSPKQPGGLSAREKEVLVLVAAGKTNRAIASELFISEKTVARHLSNIFIKLELPSRAAATAYAYRHGLVR